MIPFFFKNRPRLSSQSCVYIACPPVITGGPEALHQLAQKLAEAGHLAIIIYTDKNCSLASQHYREYCSRYAFLEDVDDDPRHLLIVPEIMTRILQSYKKIQKAIWWLSVDNHLGAVHKGSERLFKFQDSHNKSVFHFAQSHYAEHFLQRAKAPNRFLLSDYLNRRHLEQPSHPIKEDIIIYNSSPWKDALNYTALLIKHTPGLTWLPLWNMPREQVIAEMRKSKLYIDFGSHPGKERMPREAIIHGCCVIAGRRGSACHSKDLPIPSAYLFDVQRFNPFHIASRIQDCLVRYSHHSMAFRKAREGILKQEPIFKKEVLNIFGKTPYGK